MRFQEVEIKFQEMCFLMIVFKLTKKIAQIKNEVKILVEIIFTS